MATSRINISKKFENGDIPSQYDFGEIFDSFVHKDEDKANIQMVTTGTDNEHYVTPALLRSSLQNINSITGNCYFPLKENFDDFNGSTIFLKESPINFSVQAFKNGQLLLEGEDYTINYDTAVLTFSSPVTNRNIEIDYWYKNLDVTSNSGQTVAGRPYKVYTALLTQSGTSAPVATVLENTLGGEVVWSYDAAGSYSGTLAGAFTDLKTAVFITPGNINQALILNFVNRVSEDSVLVTTKITTSYISRDNQLLNTTLEIRVYNETEEITKPRGKFKSTWKTDNLSSGSSAATQVKLPLIATGTYDMVVNWGDGTTSTITAYNSPEATHTYPIAGTYDISISGVCTGWQFNNTGDRLKILTISEWGILKLGTNQGGYFYGAANLDLSGVKDTLDLDNTTSLADAFKYCSKLTTINRANEWVLSSVTDISNMFANTNLFNQDISSWDTRNVTKMQGVFKSALVFDQPIENWKTNSVTTMFEMFFGATKFNQSLENWDISNVTNMSYLFADATEFDQPIGKWNTGKVTNTSYMFRNSKFNQPIGDWNTTNFVSMSCMFYKTTAFNQPIGNWNLIKVNDMRAAFKDAAAFNQPIENWITNNVINMQEMFYGATSVFNQNIGTWNVSKVNNFTNFMYGKTPTTLSPANLDAIYNGWSTRAVLPSKSITFGTAKYTAASAAARAILTGETNKWVITDGGLA